MKLWLLFWAYWKWFCTALVTSTIILLIAAMMINALKTHMSGDNKAIETCIDRGGMWDEETGACKNAA
jgi:hypothetical protein